MQSVEDYKAGITNEMPVIIYSMWDGYVEEDNRCYFMGFYLKFYLYEYSTYIYSS